MISTIAELEIIGIRDAGNLEKERILLRATIPVDPGFYLVVNAKQRSNSDIITLLNDNVYWFPSGYSVAAGEYIRLYTKSGTYNKQDAKYDEKPAVFHNFYWAKSAAIIGPNSDALFVIKAATWKAVRVSQGSDEQA